jgi:hypothetical protein
VSKTPEELAEEFSKVNAETDVGALGCYRQGLYEGFLAGYKAAAPQWISVKDRLPETNELCIVYTEWRAIVPALYGNESWIFDEGQGWLERALSYVTHWMALPSAEGLKHED